MASENVIKANFLDFNLSSASDITATLSVRLKKQRLFQNLKQQDLAEMAGVSVGTIKNFESTGNVSLESFVRIVMALNLQSELAHLFELKMSSIEEMEKVEELNTKDLRKRAR
jgi:transcriptional regulator with XRE-family HTH domain